MKRGLKPAALLLVMSCLPALGAQASKAAILLFQQHATAIQTQLNARHFEPAAHADAELRSGEIRIDAIEGGSWHAAGALFHHWRAAAFVPGATASKMLNLLADCDDLPRFYAPRVQRCTVLSDNGDRSRVSLRIYENRMVPITLDTEYSIERRMLGQHAGYQVSRSTHIWQVDHAGTNVECRLPEGAGDGYLWKLNSYWTFTETRDGLIIECEALSLTRDIPVGLGWLLKPMIAQLQRESLETTMADTKNALLSRRELSAISNRPSAAGR